jgi:hypothetical protein
MQILFSKKIFVTCILDLIFKYASQTLSITNACCAVFTNWQSANLGSKTKRCISSVYTFPVCSKLYVSITVSSSFLIALCKIYFLQNFATADPYTNETPVV